MGSRAAPIFWEVGSWGLWQAAGGCADSRMGSKGRNPGCTIGGCGGEPAAVLVRCGQNTSDGTPLGGVGRPRRRGGVRPVRLRGSSEGGQKNTPAGRGPGPLVLARNNESPDPPTPPSSRQVPIKPGQCYTTLHFPEDTEKNDRKSRVPAAAAAFFRAARRWRSAFVSFWWHGVQSVRKLSRLQQPPPSATGTI